MVKRDILKTLWTDLMTVSVRQSAKKASGVTYFTSEILYEDEPCKLSFSSAIGQNNVTGNNGVYATVEKVVKVFCDPDLQIPAGSEICITRNGVETAYKATSEPSVFSDHQEINLEAKDKWA